MKSLRSLSAEKTALLLFGVFFVTVLLILAVAIPSPTEAQWRIFNVVLALVAAAIGALLPGVLHLQFTPWLRAGGALAVFALIFLVRPAGLVAEDPSKPLPPPPPIAAARVVMDQWLALIDAGAFESAFGVAHSKYRAQYRIEDFVRLGQQVRGPLGQVVKRQEIGQQASEIRIGDRGHIRVHMFRTQFQNFATPIDEWVTVFASDSLTWHPGGYNINVPSAPSQAAALPLKGP